MIKSIKNLIPLLSPRTRKYVPVIIFSLLFVGILEMLTVVLLLPLISSNQLNVAASTDNSDTGVGKSLELITSAFNAMGINTITQMAVFVVGFMLVKHICIVVLNYFQFRIIFSNDIWLRNKLLDKYLNYTYPKFSELKSAELIRNTAEQVGQISYGSLLSLLTILSEGVVVLVLLTLVICSIPLVSSALIVLVFMIGFLPFYVFKRRMISLGAVRFQSITKTIAEIQHIYHLYVEIRLYKLKTFFLNRVKDQSRIFTNAQVQNNVITNIPKGIIEIAAVAVILLLLLGTKDSGNFLPTIGIIVTSIFRITPSFTRISSALTQYKFSIEQINVLSSVVMSNRDTEDADAEKGQPLDSFNQSVDLRNVAFSYDEERVLLKDFSMDVKKGDMVILKGKSGTGKSTIIKIMMGLLKPAAGNVLIDGQDLSSIRYINWTDKIAYVPQRPVIIEGTLRENICLGLSVEEIDQDRYKKAIRDAQLEEVADTLRNGVITDEGGSISGGQAQRIGIARALYRHPQLLFLDEPTSALDFKNANLIISLLSRLCRDNRYTIVIISHSNEFDEYASKVIEL